jgi:predicted nuclease of predicted toxin-antitoxin system
MRMPLKLYMDHHVPRAITMGLRLRHVDVVTAYEDRAHKLADPDLLDRATQLGRVLFTQDDDLLAEATQRQQAGIAFGGVIYAHHHDVSIGQCVQDLELIAAAGTEADVANQVIYLPL